MRRRHACSGGRCGGTSRRYCRPATLAAVPKGEPSSSSLRATPAANLTILREAAVDNVTLLTRPKLPSLASLDLYVVMPLSSSNAASEASSSPSSSSATDLLRWNYCPTDRDVVLARFATRLDPVGAARLRGAKEDGALFTLPAVPSELIIDGRLRSSLTLGLRSIALLLGCVRYACGMHPIAGGPYLGVGKSSLDDYRAVLQEEHAELSVAAHKSGSLRLWGEIYRHEHSGSCVWRADHSSGQAIHSTLPPNVAPRGTLEMPPLHIGSPASLTLLRVFLEGAMDDALGFGQAGFPAPPPSDDHPPVRFEEGMEGNPVSS